MARGPKPSCDCGTCRKCQVREWARQRRRAAGIPADPEVSMSSTERVRRWREENRDRDNASQLARYYEDSPEERAKRRARGVVNDAVRTGRMVKQPCEVCGAERAQAHHDDYSKPLAVRWLCSTHHAAHHALVREEERQAA